MPLQASGWYMKIILEKLVLSSLERLLQLLTSKAPRIYLECTTLHPWSRADTWWRCFKSMGSNPQSPLLLHASNWSLFIEATRLLTNTKHRNHLSLHSPASITPSRQNALELLLLWSFKTKVGTKYHHLGRKHYEYCKQPPPQCNVNSHCNICIKHFLHYTCLISPSDITTDAHVCGFFFIRMSNIQAHYRLDPLLKSLLMCVCEAVAVTGKK